MAYVLSGSGKKVRKLGSVRGSFAVFSYADLELDAKVERISARWSPLGLMHVFRSCSTQEVTALASERYAPEGRVGQRTPSRQ